MSPFHTAHTVTYSFLKDTEKDEVAKLSCVFVFLIQLLEIKSLLQLQSKLRAPSSVPVAPTGK